MRKITQMYRTAKAEVLDIVQEFRQLETTSLKVVVGSILFMVLFLTSLFASLWLIAILRGEA